MTDTVRDLRATSDALLRDLEALVALEEEKRSLPPSDPRLTDLAERIHQIALRVTTETGAQRDLVREATATGPDIAIEAVRRSPAVVLAEWRDAEQRREMTEPGSAARAELDILTDALRREYRDAYEAAATEGHQIT